MENFVQLEHAWLIPVTIIAHANLAVQAAREPELVVAALQAILDKGRVGLLFVLPQGVPIRSRGWSWPHAAC